MSIYIQHGNKNIYAVPNLFRLIFSGRKELTVDSDLKLIKITYFNIYIQYILILKKRSEIFYKRFNIEYSDNFEMNLLWFIKGIFIMRSISLLFVNNY